jgi:hypothetical protein
LNNPIPKSNFFATPDSFDELTEMLEAIGNEEEKRMAWLGAMLALNLAHNLVEEQKETV